MGRIVVILFLFSLLSCQHSYVPVSYQFEEKNISSSSNEARIDSIIQPYKMDLDKEMNIVLCSSDTILTKSQPESDLGNFMCDMLLKKSSEYYKQNIDFTFLNHGGIRLPSLPKGNITKGILIELIPFDNRLAVMQLKGSTIDTLFNHMASKGGWHVSGARYKIKNGFATEIIIAGMPLDREKTYSVVVSDYLAQGGDNCTMLKGKPYYDLKKILRDVLIEGAREMGERGEHIKSVLDGRIQLAN